MSFERCIFEILAKLSVSQLTGLCDFINRKIDVLQLELDKSLAFTNVFQDQFIDVEAKLRSGEQLFDQYVQSSALLGVARGLSPNCGSLGPVFQGALDSADILKTGVNDATYVARQILTVNGLIQTVKNELSDAISGLRDLCGIIQLVLAENADGLAQFEGPPVKPLSTFFPKG